MRALDSVTRRRVRTSAWVLFAVVMGLHVLVPYLRLSSQVEFVVSEVIGYLSPMVVVAVLGLVLAVVVPAHGVERSNWALIASACAAVGVSEIYWSYYAFFVDPRGPSQSSWILIAVAVGVLLLLVLLARMSQTGAEPVFQRYQHHLDVLIGSLAVFPAVYFYWTLPVAGDQRGVLAASTLAIYPIVGAVMLAASAPIAFQLGESRRTSWDWLTGLAIFVYGVGLALFPVWYPPALSTSIQGPDWFTVVLGAGIDLLLVAMLYRLSATEEEATREPWPLPAVVWPSAGYLFHASAVAVLIATGWFAYESPDTAEVTPVRVGAVLLALALAARSWMAALERAYARRRANVDSDTGAFSQRLLLSRLSELIEYSAEIGHEISVVVFDFGNLSRMNRSRRPRGQETPAQSLVRAIGRESGGRAEVFRSGGDRFAVLLPAQGEVSSAELALRVWLSVRPGGGGFAGASYLGVCAGVASFPVHATHAEPLIAAAEVALAAARGAEAEPVAIYDASMGIVPAEVQASRERIRELRATVRALAEAVDARDPATRDHSTNVSELATAFAQVLGMADGAVQMIGLAALMHDVGKIGVPDEVLLKAERLGPGERIEIEEHTVLGERILSPAGLDEILPAVRSHHEWWDGTGYPDGLVATAIPVEARILAVCDAFETMTTGRPYQPALSVADALDEIEDGAGKQFDPDMAATFIRMVRGLRAHVVRAAVTDD